MNTSNNNNNNTNNNTSNNTSNNNNNVLVFSESTTNDGYNASELYIYGLDKDSIVNILYGLIALSVLTIIVNIWVLKSCKSTKVVHSTIIVFIQSLCVSDMLIGLFGLFKSLQLQNLEAVLFNCFLPESIFISASTAMCLTSLWLNTETYLRLARPFCSVTRMNKHNTTALTVFLWNMSFILGFVPQMGWNNKKFTCDIFMFYPDPYIASVSIVWLLSILCCLSYQVILRKTRETIQQSRNLVLSNNIEFKLYNHLCIMLYNDIIIFTLCYLPCVTYIIFYCINDRHKNNDMVNINLVFFLPLFLIRSLVTALIHRYRTVRINRLMCRVINASRRRVNMAGSDNTMSNIDNNHETSHTTAPTVYTITGSTVLPTGSTHQPLSAQGSNITTVTETEEISEHFDTNL